MLDTLMLLILMPPQLSNMLLLQPRQLLQLLTPMLPPQLLLLLQLLPPPLLPTHMLLLMPLLLTTPGVSTVSDLLSLVHRTRTATQHEDTWTETKDLKKDKTK